MPSEGSYQSLSELHRSRVVEYLHRNGVSSRADISQALGLTPAAITKISAKLIELGIISETGTVEGKRNRRALGLTLNNSKYRVIGVKFARSLVQIGVFDISGLQHSLLDLPPVKDAHISDTISEIKRIIRDLLRNDPNIIAVGMSVPGPYLRHDGRIAVVTSMPGWTDISYADEFENAFPVPTFIEHDARSGALAESLFDPRITSDTIAYYLVGEGVGLGVMDHEQLVNGDRGAATEIGHISIDINGRPCKCGNVGCLECYCSAVAVHQELIDSDILAQDHPDIASMTHRDACNALFAASNAGNARATELLRNISRYVGYGCVNIINAYNPRQIIIGDIMAQAGDILLTTVQKVLRERIVPEILNSTEILLSTLTSDPAITGAAATAANQFLRYPSLFARNT
ncbi:ROK family protein [Bifidobacterium aquikefiricola]|uniref:ROK family transcriptional regulator n=1 Tax=Bifidobacterium aquikefiricola TaxID=3059038 RepID=A0AB39U995_9BIFI